MNIVLSPDPVLRQVCEPCSFDDKSLGKLSKQMIKLMYKNNGCGLAAPQVGVLKRLVVIDCDVENEARNPIVMVNPEIIELSDDSVVYGEGCLSCPGITVEISRPSYAKARFFDLQGEEWTIGGDGLLGRCLQHEIDHLNGRTMFEACDPMTRLQALADYEHALAAGARPGDTGV